ncbi:MAG: hypothetical protein JXA21_19865 [Anaerolineae bacterium]|nr:hypothetical protein [Anaerolineae bacterium]
MKLFRKQFLVAPLLIVMALLLHMPKSPAIARQSPNTIGENLLVNGDFEIEDPSTYGFVWYPPNHYLALYWYRWWVNEWPSQIPEYDDMRPGGRWPPYSGKHAQVYFKWGARYEAGIYQVVENITPCMPHEFSMYVFSSGNPGTEPRAKIGLDPQGTKITQHDHVHNDLLGWPPYMQWSAWSTAFRSWDRLAVTTESLGTQMTAVAYANPSYSGSNIPFYDTWWDYGSLYQLNFPSGKLPEPASWTSLYLSNVAAQRIGDQLNVTWNSTMPASTQVWYTVQKYYEPVTPTVPLSYTVYLPLVAYSRPVQITTLDPNPVTSHSVTISLTGLNSKDSIKYWVLSRRPDVSVCVTEGHGPFEYVIP